MKKIFVTVKEFVENGGNLEVGRNIYIGKYGYAPTKHGNFDYQTEDAIYYTDNITHVQMAEDIFDCYVQIDCTPHYK